MGGAEEWNTGRLLKKIIKTQLKKDKKLGGIVRLGDTGILLKKTKIKNSGRLLKHIKTKKKKSS